MNTPQGTPRYEETNINGVTKMSVAGYDPDPAPTQPPKSPRKTVRKAMFAVAVVFTVLAMVVSMAAIGALFSQVVPPYVAYPGAAVFDGLWIYALMGEWLSSQTRRDKARTAARRAGIGFMVASMAAIVLEAYTLGHVAAGVALAFIPLGVKAAWWLKFETAMPPDLPTKWANRLKDDRAELSVQLEVAEAQYELEEHRTRLTELRAAHDRAHPAQGDGYQVTRVSEPVNQVSSAQGSPKAQRIAHLNELLELEPELTPAQVMDKLEVSLATAKRYLSEVRS
jgi:hypothetical protein